MPSKSEKQRRLMGTALSCKRKKSKCSGTVKKVAKSMSTTELRKYAKKK